MALLDFNYYSTEYKGLGVSEAEFEKLSPRAEDFIDGLAKDSILAVRHDDYDNLKENDAEFQIALKNILCQQVDVFYQTAGTNALTGGADAGQLTLIGGVPISSQGHRALFALLRKYGLRSMI